MKKTRILALILALLLVFSLTACGGKQETRKPIEILKASFDKQWDVKSAHSLVKANLNFDVPQEFVTPDQQMIMAALKEASVEIEATMDTEAGKGHIKGDLKAAGGMNFSGEAFILSENEMVLATPLFPQQIVINLPELKELYEKELGQAFPEISFTNPGKMKDDMKPLIDSAFDMVGDVIKDEKPVIESKEVEFSTGKEKVTTVTFAYKDKDVLPAMFRFMENMMNSENTIKYFDQAVEFNKKMGVDAPEIDAKMMKEEFNKAKEEFAKNKEQFTKMVEAYVTFKNMEFSFAVDKDDYMRLSSFMLDLEIKNPLDPSQTVPLKVDMTATTDKYNAVKAEDIKTTTVDSSNSIKFQDLIKGGM